MHCARVICQVKFNYNYYISMELSVSKYVNGFELYLV